MTAPMLTLWSLTAVTLAISIYAACAARRMSARFLSKRLDELSELCRDLAEDHETLRLALHREKAKNNMRFLRQSQKATEPAAPEPSTDLSADSSIAFGSEAAKDEWTRQTNLALARGEIKLPWRR